MRQKTPVTPETDRFKAEGTSSWTTSKVVSAIHNRRSLVELCVSKGISPEVAAAVERHVIRVADGIAPHGSKWDDEYIELLLSMGNKAAEKDAALAARVTARLDRLSRF